MKTIIHNVGNIIIVINIKAITKIATLIIPIIVAQIIHLTGTSIDIVILIVIVETINLNALNV